MKYLSLFSGIGGFELGIGPEHECMGYSEIDKYAVQVYEKHFNHKNYGNIETINTTELPDFDLLVGGFPCQSFSIAGKRAGFDDTRGTLFFEIARILGAKRPRLFLLENVKGLLSHDGGRTFYTIIATLDELGYDTQWQVLNSKNHGVPQNRERIFIIGHSRGEPRPQVFPFNTNDRKINDLQGPVTNTLTARYEGAQATGSYIVENKLNAQKKIKIEGYLNDETWSKRHESIRRVYSTDGLSPTIPTGTGGGVMPKIMQRGRGKNTGGVHAISPTLSTNSFQDNNHLANKEGIRKLTPRECERLQGFPDDWTAGVSDTQRYKTLGNAVTVNVIRDICKKLFKETH